MFVFGAAVVMSLKNSADTAALLQKFAYGVGIFYPVILADARVNVLMQKNINISLIRGKTAGECLRTGKAGIRPIVTAGRVIGGFIGVEAGIEKKQRFVLCR